jgi:hypothetical protein
MKTSKLILAALLLLGLVLITPNGSSAKVKGKIGTIKKHHHAKPVVQYYLVFPGSGGTYEVNGRGGQFSGTVSVSYEACVGGHLKIGGTASGTYSYNTTTGVMSVNVTDTPTGSTLVSYSGPVSSYDSSPIDLGCTP